LTIPLISLMGSAAICALGVGAHSVASAASKGAKPAAASKLKEMQRTNNFITT
jgi:hypothetical protein